MEDRRIYLPDGNYKLLTERMNVSRSTVDLSLTVARKNGKLMVTQDIYNRIRQEAKDSFGGMYLIEIEGNKLYLACQLVDGLEKLVHEDYMVAAKALDIIKKKIIKKTA